MTFPSRYNEHQRQVIEVANGWLSPDTLLFDTEATGLGDDAEIIEITIMDSSGQVLLDTLVKPSKAIPEESTAFHGITDSMVANAPTWPQVHDLVIAAFKGRTVLAYSIGFDLKILRRMATMHGLDMPAETVNAEHIVMLEGGTVVQCVMRAYAVLWHERTTSERSTGGYRWKSLGDACRSQGIDAAGAHRSKPDCEMTLKLIKAMASSPVVFADARSRTKVLN